jgi:hypothetical protein
VRTQQKYNLVQHPSLPADVMTKQVMVELALNLNSNDIVALLQGNWWRRGCGCDSARSRARGLCGGSSAGVQVVDSGRTRSWRAT